ncbi:destabilase domain-containing protein [Phthorimaea operculella]|nr:destabilase domain-containing protein [Phthorimaea operculella]
MLIPQLVAELANSQPVTEVCLGCLCQAVSGCKQGLQCEGDVCGLFHITWPYWADAGKPTLPGKAPDSPDGESSFYTLRGRSPDGLHKAVSGCMQALQCESDVCGLFHITWPYWADAGKPTLPGKAPDSPDGCNQGLQCEGDLCGLFHITWPYWADAGKPTLHGKGPDSPDGCIQGLQCEDNVYGMFHITWPYWADAGKPTLPGKGPDSPDGCKQGLQCEGDVCGLFHITWPYWADAGKPTLPGKGPDSPDGCKQGLQCEDDVYGLFHITWPYWADAGKPTLPGKAPDSPDGESPFYTLHGIPLMASTKRCQAASKGCSVKGMSVDCSTCEGDVYGLFHITWPYWADVGKPTLPGKAPDSPDGCIQGLQCEGDVCGLFHITWPYWADAGKPTLPGKGPDSPDDAGKPTLPGKGPDSPDAYSSCAIDPFCAAQTVQGYMRKFSKDCNGDGRIDCYDYIRIHQKGGYGCEGPLDPKFETVFNQCIAAVAQAQQG